MNNTMNTDWNIRSKKKKIPYLTMRRVTMVKGQRVIVLKERADFWTQGQLFVKRDKTKTLQCLFIYSLHLHFCVLPTLDFIALWCPWNL